jgi:ATP:ADP antiporter, AAA family
MGGYAIARPATESFFLEKCGPQTLPWVWLAVALTALTVTTLYNRFSANVDLGKLFAVCAFTACGVEVVLLLLIPAAPKLCAFALYVWKDIYIVVLVEVFWTFANATYRVHVARWIYGVFLASGGAGGLIGNFTVGPIAKQIGTTQALWLVAPGFILTGAASFFAMRGVVRPSGQAAASYSEGFRRVRQSRYLQLIVALVAVSQLVVTLVDYQFNQALTLAYPELDKRTAIVGQVYGYISIFETTLQLASGLVLRVLGVSASLIGVPLMLAATIVGSVLVPTFRATAVAKITSKALDYSLGRASKELLYIPLPYAEKAQGKAIVDVLTYRTAKGGVSILLLVLPAAAALPLSGLFIAVWLAIAAGLTAKFRSLTQLTT